MWCAGFSLRWLLLLRSTGSRHTGFSRCGSRALERRLSSCGARAQLLHSMRDLPGPGLEPVSPALAGGLLTTAPPGKSGNHYFDLCFPLHVPLLLLWYLPPGPPDNHLMNHLQASGRRLTAQGTLPKRGAVRSEEPVTRGGVLQEVMQRTRPPVDLRAGSGESEAAHHRAPSPPWNVPSTHPSYSQSRVQGCSLERARCVETVSTMYMIEPR